MQLLMHRSGWGPQFRTANKLPMITLLAFGPHFE